MAVKLLSVSLFCMMKILLLGEYSRLHNSLKEGLIQLGHEVVLVGTGDDFKNFPVDINVTSTLRKHFWFNKWWLAVYKLTGFDYFKKAVYHNLLKILPQLTDFDIVQLINEDAFMIYPKDEIAFYKKIFAQNEAVFLSACGEDSHIIDYYRHGKMRYSILDPFQQNPDLKNEAYYSYKYLKPAYKQLHNFVVDQVNAIIPSDFDYAIPYHGHPKVAPLIPNPVNVDAIQFKPLKIGDKINIFFGLNRLSYYKKGSHIILKVLKALQKKYPEKIQITIAENLPYDEYIRLYDNAHILIDQLYAYDQGFNALEAMAKGKCVVTGAEKEFEAYYQLTEKVAVNSLPEEQDLYQKLEELIQHPNQIIEIGKNARKFIEQHHHYIKVARQYIATWQSYI